MSQDSGTNVHGFSHESSSTNGWYSRTIASGFKHKSSSTNDKSSGTFVTRFQHKSSSTNVCRLEHEWFRIPPLADFSRSQVIFKIYPPLLLDRLLLTILFLKFTPLTATCNSTVQFRSLLLHRLLITILSHFYNFLPPSAYMQWCPSIQKPFIT